MVMDEKIYVTQEGLEELKKEYDNLVHVIKSISNCLNSLF